MQAEHRSQTVLPVRSLHGFEAQHRHIERAVAQVDPLCDGRVCGPTSTMSKTRL
jgi:hypothetical protein